MFGRSRRARSYQISCAEARAMPARNQAVAERVATVLVSRNDLVRTFFSRHATRVTNLLLAELNPCYKRSVIWLALQQPTVASGNQAQPLLFASLLSSSLRFSATLAHLTSATARTKCTSRQLNIAQRPMLSSQSQSTSLLCLNARLSDIRAARLGWCRTFAHGSRAGIRRFW